jgi:hypothetical protein
MGTKGYTVFTNLEAANIKATGGFTGDLTGNVTGAIIGKSTVEKADSYALSATERAAPFISLKNTGTGKVFTLGLAAGQMAVVYNHGTETFTVKNVADDTGTSLATTKAILVVGSATADASTVIALN